MATNECVNLLSAFRVNYRAVDRNAYIILVIIRSRHLLEIKLITRTRKLFIHVVISNKKGTLTFT